MQFQVPQFIETEDKVVGPFSIRQFIYVGSAGIISFFLYFTVELWLWALGTVFSLAIAMGLAFIKVEGRTLTHVMSAALNFYWKPQTYVWQPEHPEIPKDDKLKEEGASLEGLLSGAALRSAWKNLQTGTKTSPKQFFEKTEKYQIFQRLSGERRAARRIDYR